MLYKPIKHKIIKAIYSKIRERRCGMATLLKQMKPYWKFIVIIILAHIVQAFMILKLPEYTSNMVDIGIQNSGIDQAIPLTISSSAREELVPLLNEEEEELLKNYYYLNEDGKLILESDIQTDEETMRTIEDTLVEVLAVAQQIKTVNSEEIQAFNPVNMRQDVLQEMSVLGPYTIQNNAIQWIIEDYRASGVDLASIQFTYLLEQGGIMLLIAFLAFAMGAFASLLSAMVGAKVGRDLRAKTFAKVLQFSNNEMSHFSTASLITRSSNDVQQVQIIITILLRIVIFTPLLALGALFYVIQTQSSMLWVTFLAVLLIVSLMSGLLIITVPRFKLLQSQIDKINLYAREILTGLQVIRAFGRQDHEANRFDGANQDLKNSFLFVGRVMSLMNPVMLLIANAISVLIVWVAGHRIASGSMQVGDMMAFITYNMQVIFSFFMFTLLSIQIPRALVSSNRIQEVIDMPLSIQDKENPIVIEQAHGRVEFDNVSYRFGEAEGDVIKNISFVAKPGHTTAIIGGTGSGKSTILNLLLRFYDVSEGSIKVDGIDIRDISQQQLREMIGYVPQKGVLFSGTIASNIAYGMDNLSEEEMQLAAQISHAEEFIVKRDQNYQSEIAQGGSNVSGGQKQRLSIARAIAKKANILLFDDSFSALDYKTDISLRQALQDNIGEATLIIVAQRISTILNADQIIVLEDGEIKGIGNHMELMESSEVYREIAHSQLSEAELEREALKYSEIKEGD